MRTGNVLEDRLRVVVRAVFGVLVLVQDLAERISAEPHESPVAARCVNVETKWPSAAYADA